MSTALTDYIEKYRVCSELIFRDYDRFLQLLFENGGKVDSIVWFEYVAIENQSASLGGGGYKDSENPENMWVETQISRCDMACISEAEVRAYIKDITSKYIPHKLVPCFYIQ